MGILHILQQACILAAFLLLRESVPPLFRMARGKRGLGHMVALPHVDLAVGGLIAAMVPLITYSPRFVNTYGGRGDLANWDTRTAGTFLLFVGVMVAKHYLRAAQGHRGWREQFWLSGICLVLSTAWAGIEAAYAPLVIWAANL